MKGRVACEISTCECLIATEAIFRGLFTDLAPAEAAALLCTLVNQNKTAVSLWGADVPATLLEALGQLQALTKELGGAQHDVGLEVDPTEYVVAAVRPSMIAVRLPSGSSLVFKALFDAAPGAGVNVPVKWGRVVMHANTRSSGA